MRTVPVWSRSVDDYRTVVGNDAINALHRRAWEVSGLSMLHLNSTAFGGGVAELLLAHIPLLQDLGLRAEWRVIEGDDEFFGITKSIHNALQGNLEIAWTKPMADHYMATVEKNIPDLKRPWDVIVVHDPQPMALPALLGERKHEVAKNWIWRCHIDTQNPHPEVWSFLRPFVEAYDAVVYTMPSFVQPDMPDNLKVVISPPSIDPMSPKNAPLAPITVSDICGQYGIDSRRQLIAQVSRFDPWKDPRGVIVAYRRVKEEFPDVQLVLAGSLAHDDPEGFKLYEELLWEAQQDRDLYVLSNLQEVGNTAVNCFQRAAQVVVQKSIREGFGLTVSEAAWKAKPVIGGRAGGITIQIQDGTTGYLVDSPSECAGRIIDLLADPPRCEQMGDRGRELVRERFLTPRELADWLDLTRDLVRG